MLTSVDGARAEALHGGIEGDNARGSKRGVRARCLFHARAPCIIRGA